MLLVLMDGRRRKRGRRIAGMGAALVLLVLTLALPAGADARPLAPGRMTLASSSTGSDPAVAAHSPTSSRIDRASRALGTAVVNLLLHPSHRAIGRLDRAVRQARAAPTDGRRHGLRRRAAALRVAADGAAALVSLARAIERLVKSPIVRELVRAAESILHRPPGSAAARRFSQRLMAAARAHAQMVGKMALDHGASPSVAEALAQAAFFGYGDQGLRSLLEKNLVRGSGPRVRVFEVARDAPLDAEQTAQNIFRELTQGGRDIPVEGYPGKFREFPREDGTFDGSRIGVRTARQSRSKAPTLDVKVKGQSPFKIKVVKRAK